MSMLEENSSINPLAIIGDEDVVLGFQALGFKIYTAQAPQEFRLILDEIVRSNAAICLVQDNIYSAKLDQISEYKKLPLPIFIPFLKTAKTDLLETMIKNIRLKATGAF